MPELNVTKKEIGKLLSDMQGHKFIIPDFQRPYKWEIDKCEDLWVDINGFSMSKALPNSYYFLGTIVSYINKKGNQEIIDGQQRITSLLLLLRAFYKKLEGMGETPNVTGLKNQIAPCIWDVNSISGLVTNKSKTHLESLVVTEEDNDILKEILKTGEVLEGAKDNYSKNYSFFKQKCDDYAEREPMLWESLCVTILNKCVIMPIECDNLDTALTIFSTLNDRGLPLADSDIFKAKLYGLCTSSVAKRAFTTTWKELTDICKKANLSIDDIFRFYTHLIRGESNDKSREVGLRSFYSKDKYKHLGRSNLLQDLVALASFWRYANTDTEPNKEDGYSLPFECRKYIHCLSLYPNEFWKYIVSVFFLKKHHSKDFIGEFSSLLKKITSLFFFKFMQQPTVSAIKDDTYNACCLICTNKSLNFSKEYDANKVIDAFSNGIPIRLTRGVLMLDAYLHPKQKDMIQKGFDIEHIFPKKWQTANYNGWNHTSAEEQLEDIGNKIVLEKKLNIQAGNGYFNNKKQSYKRSNIACVIELGKSKANDWIKSDIEKRHDEITAHINKFFKENM